MFLFCCFCFFQCQSSISQQSQIISKEDESKAILFVENFSKLLNEGDVQNLKSECIVSKEDLRLFLDSEWKRKYNAAQRRKINAKFDESVENGWKEIQRDDGFRSLGSFVTNKSIGSSEKMVHPTLKNAIFSNISLTKSDQYNRESGEISMAMLYYIHAKVTTASEPIYSYLMKFPCVLTRSGKFKIVGVVSSQLVKTDINQK
ncbi:MAG: hypothetical protein IPQ18_05500 [Saprospiraceae bacterium]|nr:hypothetical protein [Saprospiraceae bacterium]